LKDISNAEFLCEKAKDVTPKLLKRYDNEQIIAIFDPPGAGLHSKVIQALRRLLI
jgi:tRNA/tmRNA/rRNA uracil-C5-methylase (TrmA/RlmC/RlmD family)